MGHKCDIMKSHTPQVGDAQTGEQLGHRSSPIGERAEPHTRLPSLGGLALGGGAPRAGLEHRSSTGGRETETPLWEGTHKVSCLGQTYLLVLKGLLGRRVQLWPSLWVHKSWWWKYQGVFLCLNS